ncbi:MAG: glycosyltransferase family 2 protein [Candidatus Thiodiazotropha sp. (ex Epidulcina cf. delphinae)]|nr:glycosyltransferase family 2 protein [Candidatus Thiodiazotropha sp. (ex Epidulcina cf. delphinae)]
MSDSVNILAIVVTYHPESKALLRLLDRLEKQVERILVVDNGSGDALTRLFEKRNRENEHLIPLEENLGVAAAQNVGIEQARRRRADYIILFDQDSEPAPDMVEQLYAVAKAKTAAGIKLAAVGPRYLDARQDNPPPFIKIKGIRVERQPCNATDAVVDVDYLISSGCLIPLETVIQVGDMREMLFIDYVDIEWGLRAKSQGYRSFGVCAATMRHDLGDTPIKFFARMLPLHSPLRHYYHFRNALWLYRQGWLPIRWKLADGQRLLLKYGFYTLFAEPRRLHWWMMTKGIWHGMGGKMGKLQENR